MIFSALWIFLMFSGVKVETDLYQIFEILLCSYFGLDHTSSFEIIHGQIDDTIEVCVILLLCAITDILAHNAH